jgi:hypothetical protein
LTCLGLNLNLGNVGGSTLLSVHVENCVYLSHGVQVTNATCQAMTRIMTGIGDLVERVEMVKHISGTR